MRILAAVDRSQAADRVVDHAVFLARGCGAELTILSVAENFRDAAYLGEGVARIEEKLLEQAREAAYRARERAESQGVHAGIVVESGVSPEDNILAYAAQGKMDIIVLGHRGRSGPSRYLLGSVAAKVAAHAPCSVFMVRAGQGLDLAACSMGGQGGA